MKKNIKIVIVLFMFNITYSQTVRPFNEKYTNHPLNELNIKYYKDTFNDSILLQETGSMLMATKHLF